MTFRRWRSRGGKEREKGRSRLGAEERRLLAWYCEHWMVIREGFNVEPVASSSSLALSIPSNQLERRCSYPSLFLLLPLLPSSTRMCGYRFRLFPAGTQDYAFPCAMPRGNRPARLPCRGQDKEKTECGAEFYILHFPFLFCRLLLFSFSFFII